MATTKPSEMTVGVVGVGRMGANIARRLSDQGFPVTAVYDVNRQQAAALAEELGSSAFDSLADVTKSAEYIITVVTDDRAMRTIFAASGDSLLVGANGKVFI